MKGCLTRYKIVFERLIGNLNQKNANHYGGRLKYLKHITPDPKKVEAVKDFPRLKNVKSVRQFLGLAGYRRRCIKDFLRIAKPLTKLLQKNVAFH